MIYSYDVSQEEKQILLECYERILGNLAWYIKSLQNETVFEDFFVCVFLLFDGFLSSSHSFTSSNEFEYVFFQNIPYSLYPFNGMGCCRHANEILFLFFQKLGYEVEEVLCELQEEGKAMSSFSRNHMVVQLKDSHSKYFFDLINWNIGILMVVQLKDSHSKYFFDLINWNIGILREHQVFSWHKELLYRFSLEDKNEGSIDLNFIKNAYEKVYQLLFTDISNLTFLYESISDDMKRISEIIKKYENYARLHITYVYP